MEQETRISNRREKFEIELWDCSGDLKYFYSEKKKFKKIINKFQI